MIRGLTARLLLLGSLAFLLCAGTFAVVLSLVRETRGAADSLRAVNERSAALNRVFGIVIDMETSMRGYVVTGDERFLEPYREGMAALPEAERRLLAANPQQPAAARRLVAAGERYHRWQIEQVELARRDPEAAARVIESGEGKRQVDRMRAMVDQLDDRQQAIAREERRQLDAALARATVLTVLGLLAIPLLLVVTVFASARHVSRPLHRMAAAARRVEEGHLDVRVPERGTGEVVDLAHSFNAMAASLTNARDDLEHHNAELEAQGNQLALTVDDLEHEKARIETFHDVVSAFANEPELAQLGPLVLSRLRSVAGARGGALYVADPIEVERGLALSETAAIDPATLPARFTADAVERELARHLLLPLASAGRSLGVVTLLDPVSRDLATLQRMADAAAVALSSALALETARHQAAVNRAVIETAHDAFVAVDMKRRITEWTPQAEALFGFTEREALGAPIDDLVVPERFRGAHHAKHDELVGLGSEARRFELPAVHRDGRRLQIEVSASALQVGDSWRINGFVRDISERIAHERAREAQRAVHQALAEAAATEDIVPRVLEALGRSLQWPVAVHWQPDPVAGELRRAAEWRDPEHRDEPVPVSVRVPISDGPTGFGAFEFWQRRAVPLDRDLQDALDAIAKLVAEVLERRRAEAETERLKNEFFALVSHELRTPLTSIIGYLELILDEEAGPVSDDQRQFLGVVERNARRLLRLVGDLLFVAQVEAGTLSLEHRAVNLETVVREAVEAGRPRADRAGVTLTAETEPVPPLDGDPERLGQVVDNLITNALKFTPSGGRVTVRCARRGDTAVIEVSDTGVGIPADEQDRLFERFFRAKAATDASVQGIGLGLSIVRAIAHGHGGEVTLESEQGVGTTVTVQLPIPTREVVRR